MALKSSLDTLDGVDEAVAALYIKDTEGDGFILDVDGSDSTAKMREFRTSAVELQKTVTRMEADAKKYKGIDPVKYAAGLKLIQQIDDETERGLVTDGKWEEVFTNRTERMRISHAEEIAARQTAVEERDTQLDTLRSSLGKLKIDQSLGAALNKAGARLRDGAMMDILGRTHGTFGVDDEGEITTTSRGPKGEKLTMEEHVDALSKVAPHLFQSGGGGGSAGAGGTRRAASGKIRVDRTDPNAMVKHHEAILKGDAEFVN